MREKGLFVTFEGGEGAGKTTLIDSLQKAFFQAGNRVTVTREPGGSSLGDKIRQLLLSQSELVTITPMAELLLFLADRSQHIEEIIKPALQQGKIVLCDRFNDSTVAYQGIGRGLGFEKVQNMCNLVTADTVPDLTFLLDVDPLVGLERVKKERVQDRIENEKLTFHEKVRQGFLTLAKQNPSRIIILNAIDPLESVFNEALKHVKAFL